MFGTDERWTYSCRLCVSLLVCFALFFFFFFVYIYFIFIFFSGTFSFPVVSVKNRQVAKKKKNCVVLLHILCRSSHVRRNFGAGCCLFQIGVGIGESLRQFETNASLCTEPPKAGEWFWRSCTIWADRRIGLLLNVPSCLAGKSQSRLLNIPSRNPVSSSLSLSLSLSLSIYLDLSISLPFSFFSYSHSFSKRKTKPTLCS